MKTTLETIAQNTGYSKSTISRVLNGKANLSRISRHTVEIIRAEAKRCGYTQNLPAKKLRNNSTHTIGLLIPSISNPYFADIASVIISEAQKFGYVTIVTDTMENEELQNASITALLSRQVDGIIIAPCGNDSTYLEQINDNYMPVVLFDRCYEDSSLPYVVTNNFHGGYMATSYLIQNGHNDIVCIQGQPEAIPNIKRVEGYLHALKQAGIESKAMITGNDFSIQNGYMETKLLFNNNHRPSAIFALSNTIGLGALKAIRETGLLIPDDISLISFDDNIYLDFLTPPITRIGQLVNEMGKLSVKLLFDNISKGKSIKSQIELAPEMVLRNSVRPLTSRQ